MKTKILLGIIIVLALVLRFYKIGESPKGFYVDEAAIGYNAYSLMMTGKDEYGKSWPILLRSFADYKAPVYTYFLIPIYAIFGMSVVSTRALSAGAGVLTVLMVFLMVKKLGGGRKLALVSALLLALSPWAIIFSRTTYEASLGLLLMSVCIYTFLIALDKAKWWPVVAVEAVAAIMAYHAQRVVVPLLLLLLAVIWIKKVLVTGVIKWLILAVILGFVLILPTLSLIKTNGFQSRAATLNIFNFEKQNPQGYVAGDNKIILSIKEFGALYLSYFSPRYLFITGDFIPRNSYPDLATFFSWQLPFYLYGWWWLIKSKKEKKLRILVTAWMVVAPIPAALTRDPYSALRALPLVVPMIILVGAGVRRFLEFKWAKWILAILILYSVVKLGVSGLILNNYLRYDQWDYGMEVVADQTKDNKVQEPVVFDAGWRVSYIQLAFFLKVDPKTYQNVNRKVDLGHYYDDMNANWNRKMGNVEVRSINWQKDEKIKQILIGDQVGIGDNQIGEHNLELLWQVRGPDGKILYQAFQTHPEIKAAR